jgi:CBF/Mak21 family
LIVSKLLEQHISRADNMSKGTLRCIKIMSTISAHSKNMETKGFLFKLFHNMFKRISSLENRKNALKSTKLLNLIISGIENTMEGQSLDETTTDIYRVAYTSNIKTRVDSLKLIYSMCKAKQEFPKKYYNCMYDILREPDLSKSSSLEDMFELLYKSLKVDSKLDRTVSVIKRLLQKALISGTDFIVASLLLVSKLSQSNKLLHQWIITKEMNLCEKEVFVDVGEENTNEEARSLYDSQKRDCEFTKAYDSNLWELDALSRHQHPRVRQMVQSIIEGTYEKYDGNPLLDFKGINFLDKISYKNPKKLKRFFKGRSSNMQQPLNMVQLEDLNTDESMVFYKYFTTKQKLQKDKKKGHKVPQVSKEQQEPQDEEAELDDFLKGEIKKKKMYDGTE